MQTKLLGSTLSLASRSEAACPLGITGAWDGDLQTRDPTFTIQCHSDAVRVECCQHLQVLAFTTGDILLRQLLLYGQVGSLGQLGGAGVAGEYSRVGDHNGHPLYTGPANTALWYRKAGWGPDGWMRMRNFGLRTEWNSLLAQLNR